MSTSIQAGLLDSNGLQWVRMILPIATPTAVIRRLHEDAVKAFAFPGIKARMAKRGADRVSKSPEAFTACV